MSLYKSPLLAFAALGVAGTLLFQSPFLSAESDISTFIDMDNLAPPPMVEEVIEQVVEVIKYPLDLQALGISQEELDAMLSLDPEGTLAEMPMLKDYLVN